jgi:hypothetical protein
MTNKMRSWLLAFFIGAACSMLLGLVAWRRELINLRKQNAEMRRDREVTIGPIPCGPGAPAAWTLSFTIKTPGPAGASALELSNISVVRKE